MPLSENCQKDCERCVSYEKAAHTTADAKVQEYICKRCVHPFWTDECNYVNTWNGLFKLVNFCWDCQSQESMSLAISKMISKLLSAPEPSATLPSAAPSANAELDEFQMLKKQS
jgi:hypothetical protein